MLAFIIPLKSSQLSSSWERVCQLLERTLKSVCNQTSSNFEVIIVCHEKPELSFSNPKVRCLSVDLPLPGNDFVSKEKDQICKMLLGMIEADSMNPSHIMFVDADDCVSNRLVEFVDQNIDQNGWFIGKGYEYREDIQQLKYRSKGLHLRSNTSHIIRMDLLKPYLTIPLEEVRRENFIRDNFILYHPDTANILKRRGTPLKELPFPGMVYITDNGENIWWSQSQISEREKDFYLKNQIQLYLKKVYQKLITRPLTPEIQQEFYLY
ncbi:glycosyltransferase family A protein [Planktothrix sp. FACHB-1365]|uniref:glycosyltransferase family A protein n=1 Tax=Planktothrix sp. FACHB-1365 TaxID=2692855 RepID=UPI0016893574|nr:glycosyltransferase family A protein [Planktothrix sp. FACHB-1365]MBD2482375.1 glycosyltransferase family 2 protein [Planktothrix sp. FACHB-1365]